MQEWIGLSTVEVESSSTRTWKRGIGMDFEEREMTSSRVPWLGDEVEEYLSYFTKVQGQYLKRWVWKGMEKGKENEQFLQGKDKQQAKSLQSMAYRIKGMVLEQWEEGKMVPREVYLALNSIVPVANGDRLCFEKKRVGRRREVPMRGGREVQVQAPVQAPAAISAPAPAPIPGHYTMEQALAVINGKEKERELELSAIVKSLDEIPNTAGAMAGAAQASNEFDIKVALAQYKAKPIDPSVRERVSKGMYGDSEPTSEFPTEDELLNAKGNGNDE